MNTAGRQSTSRIVRCIFTVALSLTLLLGLSEGVRADEADAKQILKKMSDFMKTQQSLSFEFDATLEVITTDDQKLALASSGAVKLKRPDRLHVARAGGFADMEMFFDGKTLTLLGKSINRYAQLDVPGSVDHLIDEMKVTYNWPLPAADLLLSDAYDELMRDVVDTKDLGYGVVGGVKCDHLAFRTSEVDWQIWIAHGERPYPMRFVIASKLVNGGPQYTVQTRAWKAGGEMAATDFTFTTPTTAEKVDLKDLKGTDDLPGHFVKGDAK